MKTKNDYYFLSCSEILMSILREDFSASFFKVPGTLVILDIFTTIVFKKRLIHYRHQETIVLNETSITKCNKCTIIS